MTTISVADGASVQTERGAAIRKVWLRLIPFLFVLYIFNYLDRINIGFAALSMNKDLALTATTFGLANSIFYIGYVACEIPSNLLMVRYGARVWIARILISWGLASAATMLVVGPNSLYLVRFLVGVLEAGFVPGVLLYLTYWIPNSHRARANGYLMMAQPVAMALGAGVSGLILDNLNGALGLQGWRWLFLLEGLPAVILGVIAYVYLTDKPKDAAWLDEPRKTPLTSLLADDQPASGRQSKISVWRAGHRAQNSAAGAGVFLPGQHHQCQRHLDTDHRARSAEGVFAVAGRFRHGDTGDRSADPDAAMDPQLRPDAGAGLARDRGDGMAAIGWLLVIYFPEPELRLVGLIFTVSGAFCAMSTFWTLPQSLLSEAARPAGIGLISAVGLLGSAVSPAVIGFLRDATGSFSAGLFYVTALLAVSIVLILIVSRLRPVAA